jgi:hypothetical protein
MSLTRDARCARSCARMRTSPAAPVNKHLIGLGPLGATLLPAGLALCTRVTPGGQASSRGRPGDGGLARAGIAALSPSAAPRRAQRGR